MLFIKNKKYKQGQTIIETLAAAFILVMGIASAVGLSVYSLNSSSLITKQIIGIGLAREALDAFKSMRDTNWLQQNAIDTNCYNFVSGANDTKCYSSWLGPGGGTYYKIDKLTGGKLHRLATNPASDKFWDLKNNGDNNNWGLDFDTDVSNSSFEGFYNINNVNVGVSNGKSDYYRTINLQEDTTEPYNKTNFPRLHVTVQVWWKDRRCPQSAIWPGEGKCGVQMETYFTNWKNY